MYAALLDIGEPTAKLVGSIDVLMEGIKGQLVDRKLLSFNDQLIFTETLRIIESELRKVAGIKERSFAELIAEKVVQKKDVKATAADATEAGDDKSVLTIHVADLTATYLCNQCRFDQCREWEDLKKLAHRPGCAVKISPVRASRLRTLLEPKLPAVAEAIYCVRGDRYAIRTTDLSVKVIEPAQAVEN